MTMDAGDRSTLKTKTGWGQSGTLITGDKTRRVTMQADFNKGVGAFDFTAQFNTTPPGSGGAHRAVVNAEALVHWRVEGQEVTRRITIGAGATLTGVGQAVRIEITDATPAQFTMLHRIPGTATLTTGSNAVVFSLPLGNAVQLGDTVVFSTQPKVQYFVGAIGPLPGDLQLTAPYTGPSSTTATASDVFEKPVSYGVSVQVSAGVRGSSGQPPVLQPFNGPPYTVFGPADPAPGTGFSFNVAPLAGGLVIAIPEDAGVTQVFVTASTDVLNVPVGPAQAQVQIANGAGIQRAWDPQVNTGWVPIPPGAETLSLFNGGPRELFYSVTFGIDG